MTSPFRVVEHIIPGQHIREHPHALRGRQETALKLAIKQYIPCDQTEPILENAVTIIGAHGNGFPKEVDEGGPLRPTQEAINSSARHLDRGCLQSRRKWCSERTCPGRQQYASLDVIPTSKRMEKTDGQQHRGMIIPGICCI